MVNNLEEIAENIRKNLEAKHAERERLVTESRVLTRHCANAIRAMHRQEWDDAQVLLKTARAVVDSMRQDAATYPDLYYAGYTQDSIKEYIEAVLTLALIREEPLPTPQELQVEHATYLNGMAEASTELRRYILDILRHEHSDEAERLLAAMDAIYDTLVTFDFPDAISGGLRHRTDNVRGVLERTRGDMTTSLRQQRLQAALDRAEARLAGPPLPDLPKDAV
jgi:translin